MAATDSVAWKAEKMMAGPLVLYALCGSLRESSKNRALLEALKGAAPADVAIEICDLLGQLPIFNPDLEGEATPASVTAFAAKIAAADGLIIASPEYAHGIPGGLKNALDWLVSRAEIPHKPVMQAHASQRGDHALDALTEVLKTMSVRLVGSAFLRVDLLGKTPDQLRAILTDTGTQAMLQAKLRRFAQEIGQEDISAL